MAEDQLVAGRILADRFVLEAQIGVGGAGVVWRAADRQQEGRLVALKLLHPALRENPAVRRRLAREAEILSRLDHPHLAKAVAFEARSDIPFLATALIEGPTLHHVLYQASTRSQPLPLAEVLTIFEQLCSAVGYAHGEGVIHRDLKPKNIIVSGSGPTLRATVLDLGVARLIEGQQQLETTIGRRIGTVLYMSPEQTRGERAGTASDVFALGSILYELLTLHRAWARDARGRPLPARADIAEGPNAMTESMARIAAGARPVPSELRSDLPMALDVAVARALAIGIDERPPTVAQLWEETALAARAPLGPRPDPEITDQDGTDVGAPAAAPPRIPTDTVDPSSVVDTAPDPPRPPEAAIATRTWSTPAETAPTAVVDRERGPVAVAIDAPRARPSPALALLLSTAAVAAVVVIVRSQEAPLETKIPSLPTRTEASPPAVTVTEIAVEPPVEAPSDPPKRSSPPPRAGLKSKPLDRALESAPRPLDELDRIAARLSAAKQAPRELDRLIELGAMISDAAALVPDEKARAAIRRIARASADMGDVAGLEIALEDLRRARRSEAVR